MAQIKWITIREASELTGRQPRTIRYHIQKFKEKKPSVKELNNCINYIEDRFDQKLLMINEAFIFKLYPSAKKRVAKGDEEGVKNDNMQSGAIASQQSQPNINEIEDLVQRRMKVMNEANNREVQNLKEAHANYLELLKSDVLNLMSNHQNEIVRLQESNQQQVKQLTNDKQYLQLQLNTKDETVKILLEEMKALRIERGNVNTDYVQIEQVEPKQEIEETNIINDVDEVVDTSPLGDDHATKKTATKNEENNQLDIDEAIQQGMTFADWLNRKK